MRSGPWKLHLSTEPGETEGSVTILPGDLYQLHWDPSESRNVAEKHPDVVQRLVGHAKSFDANLRQNLRPLGRLAD